MTVTIQTFNRAGWPANFPIELADDAAAAILTAARDYQAETGHDLHGDYLAAPVGGLRTAADVDEMIVGFRLHKAGQPGWQAIYAKYNMDEASKAQPSHNTHETGECGDVSDSGFLAWLKAGNAKRYGLVFTLSPPLSTLNDLRHCQYFPGTATVALDVHGLDNETAAPRSENVSYDLVPGGDGSTFAMVATDSLDKNGNPPEVAISGSDWPMMIRIKGNLGPVSADENKQYRALLTMLNQQKVTPSSSAATVDTAALAKAIADEFNAALAQIKFPTKGTIELA